MITFNEISFSYGKKQIIKDISFQVKPAECLVLAGENGSGKSTILKLLAGIIKPSSGKIQMDGTVGYIPQGIALFEDMTVLDNIRFFSSMSKESLGELPFNLEKYKNVKVSKLSGGLAKILSITCAIVTNPINFLYDEPCANLDVKYAETIKKIIKLQKKQKASIVYVAHSYDEFCDFYDKLLFIDGMKCKLYNKKELNKEKYLTLFKNGGNNEKM